MAANNPEFGNCPWMNNGRKSDYYRQVRNKEEGELQRELERKLDELKLQSELREVWE